MMLISICSQLIHRAVTFYRARNFLSSPLVSYDYLFVQEVDAILQSSRDGNPRTRGKHVQTGLCVNIVKEMGAGQEGGKKEGNDHRALGNALEPEKDLVPCLRSKHLCVSACVHACVVVVSVSCVHE